MDDGNIAQAFAATFVDALSEAGLEAVCVAPGSRSAPLAMAFARHPRVRVWMHLDERSCSFFALGLALATAKPVALLCTSGTAAAEFHAAVVEAFHSRAPLVVLTADRPPELRGVGANQAIDQAGIYGSAVRWSVDPGVPTDLPGAARLWRRLGARAMAEASGPPAGPVHLNLPFREPLTPPPGQRPEAVDGPRTRVWPGRLAPDPAAVDELVRAVAHARRPLLVAGAMTDGSRLAPAIRRCGLALMAEPGSQLRRASIGAVPAYDALLRDAVWPAAHRPDLVIRVGAPPTSKALNQWLAAEPIRTIVIDPEAGWQDPDQVATDFVRADPRPLLAAVSAAPGARAWAAEVGAAGRTAWAALDAGLAEGPLHEGHAVRALGRALRTPSNLVVGSSMPIRDLDTFWDPAVEGHRFWANRGASGIDGVVSTALGVSAGSLDPTVLLIGDLSLYHDMNGLWALRRHHLHATLVVLDNDGGGIFSFLPPAAHEDVFEELFGTPLGLDLESVARLYGLGFESVSAAGELEPALRRALGAEAATMLRVRFERSGSVAGHRACWKAVTEALSASRDPSHATQN